MLYVKRPNRDTWHWIRNCSYYKRMQLGGDVSPTSIKRGRPKSGELCNECLAKEKKQNKKKK